MRDGGAKVRRAWRRGTWRRRPTRSPPTAAMSTEEDSAASSAVDVLSSRRPHAADRPSWPQLRSMLAPRVGGGDVSWHGVDEDGQLQDR